jgi:APA family basic amino acid/polyamine antiporter
MSLYRGLGLIGAAGVTLGSIIGTGVFLKARVMTCNVETPVLVLLAWFLAGLLSLAGALTYAELSAMMPKAAGEYVILNRDYGPRLGFLWGWTQSTIAYTGGQAAKAVAFAIFLNVLLGGALDVNYVTLEFLSIEAGFGGIQLAALSTIAIVTLVNLAAVTVTGHLAVALTSVKIVIILAIGIGAFLAADGDWARLLESGSDAGCEDVAAAARTGTAGFAAAMLGALWAYDGWNYMVVIAGEIKDPERTIPRGLIGGVGVVIGLYLFVNLAYFYVLTPAEVASVSPASSVAAEVTRKFLGAAAVSLIAASMLISTLGSLHSGVLTGARIPFVMARDRLFFSAMNHLSPRTRVPTRGVLWIGFWSGVLALSGSFDKLTDYVIFAEFLFYGLVAASIFLLRRRLPETHRPYHAWGYPVVPALFVITSGWLVVNTLLTSPMQSLIGLVLIALGLPFYEYWSRRR